MSFILINPFVLNSVYYDLSVDAGAYWFSSNAPPSTVISIESDYDIWCHAKAKCEE